jgi:heterodisulfide reductase subunit A-like polyferredoxin
MSQEVEGMVREMKGLRLENDWTREQLEKAIKRFHNVVTIPVDVEIEGDRLVLNLEEARRILEGAERIVLMDCMCRVQRGNCEAPVHTCLRLNERAQQALEIDELRALNPREVTVQEALKTLEESHRSGLIHLAIAVDQSEVNEVCSCCECCCMALSAALRFGLAPKMLTSKTVSSTDVSKCVACRTCIERCRFDAREIVGGSLIIHSDKCMGCGLCVSTCPAQAIKLIYKGSSQQIKV